MVNFIVMAETKFSNIRYRIIDRCLRNPIKRYQIQDLIDECQKELNVDGISRRTIYYDLDFMKGSDGWNAPIDTIKDGNKRYYYYTDSDFSIYKKPLSDSNMKQIKAAIDLLKLVDGLPQFKGMGDSLEKIEMLACDSATKPCLSFDHNEYLVGKEFLTDLFNAIQYETVLKIKYKPFDLDEVCHVFHSQFLKQYNNRWYIFGVEDSHRDQIWNLALDRIKGIESTKIPYLKLDVDWVNYFDEIIGVTNVVDDPVEEIHFLVHGRSGHYVMTKPIHESQRAHWIDDNTLDVKLSVKINYELKRLLLSYAPDITILAPQSLIEEHKKSLQKALEQYEHDN